MKSDVEQLAQEQFRSAFRNRLCEMLSEIKEEYISAFIQGYAKCETDIKFESKQVAADSAESKQDFKLPRDILSLWEQTICEIRGEIKTQSNPALVYAKELCDKLEQSMCAIAGGNYNLRYTIGE